MIKQYQLTLDGKTELSKELDELKSQRGAIAEKIANARDYGDLSENAEYDSARDEQVLVESRIGEIELILKNASIIKAKNTSKVEVGNTVTLKTAGMISNYTIVGPVEANPLEGRISNESPIGRAALGKKVGETLVVVTPKGTVKYEITKIG